MLGILYIWVEPRAYDWPEHAKRRARSHCSPPRILPVNSFNAVFEYQLKQLVDRAGPAIHDIVELAHRGSWHSQAPASP
jgi:hypothetical protein